MSSQLVDLNGDKHNDILVGSFSGVPYWIPGSADGYRDPERILDANGDTVLIADFWNDDTDKWDSTERAKSTGHCTSVAAVDWDADGDLDLLLGDYYGGRLFWRRNEGSSTEPKFATTNEPVLVGAVPAVIEHGLAAPRVADFNRDGLFDILCGGSKGGVYCLLNTGNKSAPKFATLETLIAPVDDPAESFIRKVPAIDGQPTQPGSSLHIDLVDYDGDGDQDLLVGARSSWSTGPVRTLTDDEEIEQQKLASQMDECRQELGSLYQQLQAIQESETESESDSDEDENEDQDENEDANSSEEPKQEPQESAELQLEIQKLSEQMGEINSALEKYDTDPTAEGDFVWLFRRKASDLETTSK